MGVSQQIVTQLAVGHKAVLAQEVGMLLAGLAPHGEVRTAGTWMPPCPQSPAFGVTVEWSWLRELWKRFCPMHCAGCEGCCPSAPQVLSSEDLQAGRLLLFDPFPIPGRDVNDTVPILQYACL